MRDIRSSESSTTVASSQVDASLGATGWVLTWLPEGTSREVESSSQLPLPALR